MKHLTTTLLALSAGAVLAPGCIFVEDDDDAYLEAYEPCSSSWQCEFPADGCYSLMVDYGRRIVTDRMCTLECQDDFDCPWGGACYQVMSGPPICYQRCDVDYDCPPGFACIDTVGGRPLDAICLPY